MTKGDLALFELPFQQGGREQAGTRPALIISSNNNQSHKMITVIPFTTSLNTNSFPDTCIVKPSNTNGLTEDSIALIFQLRAISLTRFKKRLGVLDPSTLAHMEKLIKN